MELLYRLAAYRTELIWIVAGLAVLVVLQRVARRIRRWRRPARLHPNLRQYAGLTQADAEAERQAAMNIISTSSTRSLAGYEIVQQIEAVFVEGRRSPEEALRGLKAVAGTLGANAVINLTHERTTAGRATARGDAVIVRPTVETAPTSTPSEPTSDQPPSAEAPEP
ncbi:MAG: hypothetical protein GY842_28255 [bacterium]|nr:hypothetical protein [bacterium]